MTANRVIAAMTRSPLTLEVLAVAAACLSVWIIAAAAVVSCPGARAGVASTTGPTGTGLLLITGR